MLLALLLLASPVHQRPSPSRAAPAEPAPQLSDDEIRQQVHAYLATIDTPIAAARWKALGPRAALVLEPLIADPKTMPSQRAHALDGLVAAAPDRAAAVLPRLLHDEEAPVVLRVSALHGAGRVLSAQRLAAELKPVLETAREPGVRGVAAQVLARHGGCAAVQAQAAREGRQTYANALETCEQ